MSLRAKNYLGAIVLLIHLLGARSTRCATDADKLASIDSMITYAAEKVDAFVGLGFAVAVKDHVLFAKGYGLRNASDSQSHVDNRTIFAIGSSSKAFTSYLIDGFRKEGKVDWSDKVTEHIPEFKMEDMCATENIQVADLAAHSSGLPRHDQVWYGSNFPRSELIQRVQYLKPSTEFREMYQYNNIMVTVEGIVCERVSKNKTWEQLVHERILSPLGMHRSYPQIREAWDKHVDNIASGHTFAGGSKRHTNWLELTNVAPCGGIVSTAEDMGKWVQEQLKLTGRSTEMHDIRTPIPSGDASAAIGYGYGWFIGYPTGKKAVFHGGRTIGFVAFVTFVPEDNVGVVSLTNTGTRPMLDFINNLNVKVASIMKSCTVSEAENRKWVDEQAKLAADKQAALEDWNSTSVEPPKIQHPEQFVGKFENPGYGIIDVFVGESGKLAGFFNMNITIEARTVRDFFDFSGVVAEFKRNVLGDVIGVYVDYETEVSPIYFKKKVPAELLTKSYLEQFVGVYGGGKIKVTLVQMGAKLSLRLDGSLTVTTNYYEAEITPTKHDWFSIDRSFVEFVRVNGVVQQLKIHQGDSYKLLSKS